MVLSCSSKYAKRLYASACQWRTIGYRKSNIYEFKQMLGLIDKKGNKQYKQIGQLKEKVLEVAKRQINENTDIEFDYRLVKRGRSFEEIEIFVDRKKTQAQLQIDLNKDIGTQKFYNRLLNSGFTEEQAKQISNGTNEAEFDKLLNDLQRNKDVQVKTNSIAYIVGVYKNKRILK